MLIQINAFCWRDTGLKSNNETTKSQGLQAFGFWFVTVNDEHMKPRFQREFRGWI